MKPPSENEAPPTPGDRDLQKSPKESGLDWDLSQIRDDAHLLSGSMKDLVKPGGPLIQLINEVKNSNRIAQQGHKITKTNQSVTRIALVGMVICLLLLGGTTVFLYRATSKIEALQRDLEASRVQISDELQKATEKTSEHIEAVKETTDAIVEESKTQAKVELIEETDPKKAEKVPVRVRVTPPEKPKKPKQAPSSAPSAVEYPLNPKDVQVMPSASASSKP